MTAILKGTRNGGPSLASVLPGVQIGPFGDMPGTDSGAGELLGACDMCYVDSSGRVMRAIEDQTGTTAAVNDVQTMTSSTPLANIGATSTYSIGYKGVVASGLTPASNAAAVQAALVALSTIGAGNITVGGAFPLFTFTAAGTLAGTELDLLDVESSLQTVDNKPAVLGMAHTTVGQPVGNSGAEQSSSRVRGFSPMNEVKRGHPVTLYHNVIVYYSDGLLTPGADVFLSGTVPGGLDTVATLTTQKPLGFCMDTTRIFFFAVK